MIINTVINELIIYSKTWDEHVERLDAVFTRLREHGLKLNPKNVIFGRKSAIWGIQSMLQEYRHHRKRSRWFKNDLNHFIEDI